MSFTNFYFGIDSGSAGPFPCAGNGANYYIGRVGGGVKPDRSIGWNTQTAQLAGKARTFAYWDIEGPGKIPTGQDAQSWGGQQAAAFVNEVLSGSAAQYVGGRTFFGDIESGNLGWSSGNVTQRHDIVYGFLLETVALTVTGGLYANLVDWDNLLGQSWLPTINFVWWLADGYPAITTCLEAENNFNSLMVPSTNDRGGLKVMIWQYNLTPSSSRDLDVTPYSGYLSGTWNPTPA
jgi:hypothetical protein